MRTVMHPDAKTIINKMSMVYDGSHSSFSGIDKRKIQKSIPCQISDHRIIEMSELRYDTGISHAFVHLRSADPREPVSCLFPHQGEGEKSGSMNIDHSYLNIK